MINTREVERIRLDGDHARAAKVFKSAREPVIFEETDSPAFQRLAALWTDDHLESVGGNNELDIRYYKNGVFELEQNQASQTMKMSMSDFFGKLSDPGDTAEYYCLIPHTLPFAKPLFNELGELSNQLGSIVGCGQPLNSIWIGPPRNITPLHYDPFSRLHGTIRGEKLFIMFPPDLRHLRLLDTVSLRSGRRKHSHIGLGPLDEERFPKLAKCDAVRALLGPGDFLYIPPCWWHHVSILDEKTITSSVRWVPREIYLLWSYWRLRLGDWFFTPLNQ